MLLVVQIACYPHQLAVLIGFQALGTEDPFEHGTGTLFLLHPVQQCTPAADDEHTRLAQRVQDTKVPGRNASFYPIRMMDGFKKRFAIGTHARSWRHTQFQPHLHDVLLGLLVVGELFFQQFPEPSFLFAWNDGAHQFNQVGIGEMDLVDQRATQFEALATMGEYAFHDPRNLVERKGAIIVP